jgi:hypothetical protein
MEPQQWLKELTSFSLSKSKFKLPHLNEARMVYEFLSWNRQLAVVAFDKEVWAVLAEVNNKLIK